MAARGRSHATLSLRGETDVRRPSDGTLETPLEPASVPPLLGGVLEVSWGGVNGTFHTESLGGTHEIGPRIRSRMHSRFAPLAQCTVAVRLRPRDRYTVQRGIASRLLVGGRVRRVRSLRFFRSSPFSGSDTPPSRTPVHTEKGIMN